LVRIEKNIISATLRGRIERIQKMVSMIITQLYGRQETVSPTMPKKERLHLFLLSWPKNELSHPWTTSTTELYTGEN
jgi:hypothetical protein